jgi:hypothetical protein
MFRGSDFQRVKDDLPDKIVCNLMMNTVTIDNAVPFFSLTMPYDKFFAASLHIGTHLNNPDSPGYKQMQEILGEVGLGMDSFIPLYMQFRSMETGKAMKFDKLLLPAAAHIVAAVNDGVGNKLSPPATPAVSTSPYAGGGAPNLGLLGGAFSPASVQSSGKRISRLDELMKFDPDGIHHRHENLFNQKHKNKHGVEVPWRDIEDALKRGSATSDKMSEIASEILTLSVTEVETRFEEALKKLSLFYLGVTIEKEFDQRFLLDDLRPELSRLAALLKADPGTYRLNLATIEMIVSAAETESPIREANVRLRQWYLEWSVFIQFKAEPFVSGQYLQQLGRYHDVWPKDTEKLFALSHQKLPELFHTVATAHAPKVELSKSDKEKLHKHADKAAEERADKAAKEAEQKFSAELKLRDEKIAKLEQMLAELHAKIA